MTLHEAKNGWFVVVGMERFDQVNMMQDTNRWPYETFLPVKRTAAKRKSEFGIMLAAPHVQPKVFSSMKADAELLHDYGTFDAMLDDGWRVD